ncbi:hypothetical protein L596_023753 [Steinernema carpocapsae]|uniref:Uncharacterized protein n=1 Tax=Steinernema carpocapsae TaxID=34508 RepID=A0A4U5MEN2_STECR|nr:hypothetical protein L596_023753 [Steinernema carpocapsae]
MTNSSLFKQNLNLINPLLFAGGMFFRNISSRRTLVESTSSTSTRSHAASFRGISANLSNTNTRTFCFSIPRPSDHEYIARRDLSDRRRDEDGNVSKEAQTKK